jgi:hypothetical protein
MKTDITDNYPYLGKLECQFYGVCAFYEPGKCQFNQPCKKYVDVEENKGIKLRTLLSKTVENYVKVEDMKLQIDLIRNDDMNEETTDL